ncbi:MAG: GNAT family N-acetyltransferase [Acetobacteraceae bacterium]|nr:GNAT family N-acetyltransferase [Acetobacteraceae bacterium]
MDNGAGIIAARPIHARAMAAIHAAGFRAAERWSAEAIGRLLALPVCFGLLHPAGGMLVGRVMADEAELLTVAVDPTARRQGLGTALARRAIAEARGRGARSMFLEVSAENGGARRLYGALGFAAIGRRPKYYAGGGDALVMKRTLSGPGEVEAG